MASGARKSCSISEVAMHRRPHLAERPLPRRRPRPSCQRGLPARHRRLRLRHARHPLGLWLPHRRRGRVRPRAGRRDLARRRRLRHQLRRAPAAHRPATRGDPLPDRAASEGVAEPRSQRGGHHRPSASDRRRPRPHRRRRRRLGRRPGLRRAGRPSRHRRKRLPLRRRSRGLR